MASELSSIPGLRPKHAAVLTGTLQMSTVRQLANAYRRVLHAGMRRLRPALTLEAISGWQDHARELAEAHAGQPATSSRLGGIGWEQSAAFVVSFETRETSADQDHRLVVEQVEQAPPEPRQEWPTWTPDAAWTWMLERAEASDDTSGHAASNRNHLRQEAVRSGRPRKGSAARRRAAKEPEPEKDSVQENASLHDVAANLGRIQRRIAVGTPELALEDGTVSRLEADGPDVDVPPHAAIRVIPTCEHGMRLHVALRLRRFGAPSYAPSPPVTVVNGETAEIGL